MKIYRIRNKEGLFSKGGMNPFFTKKGKVWISSGALRNHFNLIEQEIWSYTRKEYYWKSAYKIYKDCKVIEIDFETGETQEYDVTDFYQSKHKENVNG